MKLRLLDTFSFPDGKSGVYFTEQQRLKTVNHLIKDTYHFDVVFNTRENMKVKNKAGEWVECCVIEVWGEY